MASLYELTNDLIAFQEMCNDPDADLNDEAIKDTLEGLEGSFDDKVECWVKVIKNLSGELTAVKEEADRLTKRTRTIKNNIDRMKRALITSMELTGRKTAGNVLKATVAQNGGVKPIVIDENAEIPFEFQKVTVEPNNEAIRDALDHGKELPFAHFGERGVHINIK